MMHNQHSFYSTNSVIYDKCSNIAEDIILPNNEAIFDTCEGSSHFSKNTLNHCWSQYFYDYGVSLQDGFTENADQTMPLNSYLQKSIGSIISNNFYGLVKVISSTDEDYLKISTAVLPVTIMNFLRYTPHRMENNEVAVEFIIYQILSAVEELHMANIPLMNLTLDKIYLDENFIAKLSLPNLNEFSERVKQSIEKRRTMLVQPMQKSENLEDVLWQWMYGKISNLEYLLYLNKLAGRTELDPNNHFMIPWVTDFRDHNGGLRDLKLSKFRINKGDDHLDKIYQDQLEEFEQNESNCPLNINNMNAGNTTELAGKSFLGTKSRISKGKASFIESSNQHHDYQPSNPHHVSDILSELSYYAYMARVTPIDILKKSYRSFYNPQEFRWDMAKMYDWTPDECIPQFFTDPSVFRSMHPDMPDIELPKWCQNADEFVIYHRQVLESEPVSKELHHWIDLVFGYKLVGDAAIVAKNVHRQFADKNIKMINNGSTVLFRTPHPKRLCCFENLKKYFGSKRPENTYDKSLNQLNETLISLPDDYDPMEFIDYLKDYSLFIQDSCAVEAIDFKTIDNIRRPFIEEAFVEDIISVCCLIIEIFNYNKLRSDYLFTCKDLSLRVECCYLLFIENSSLIPIKYRDSIEKIISNARKKGGLIPDIFELKRSDKWFLFNKSTVKLFDMIKHIYTPSSDKLIAVKQFFLNQMDNSKFQLKTLNLMNSHLIYLLKPDANINFDTVLDILICITQKFGLVTGKSYFIKEVLPCIISLYPSEISLVKSQHALLYQRTFLNLLLIRIGMVEFLNNMVELLVKMLVIGQNAFASMKEPTFTETDIRNFQSDTESLNEFENSSIWYSQNDDDECVGRDKRTSQISVNSEGENTGLPEQDTISQASLDIEEPKLSNTLNNGYGIPNQRNVLDNLPLSDTENTDDISQIKMKNGTFAQLLVSPFRKVSSSKQKPSTPKSSKIQARQMLSEDCSKMTLAKLSCSSLIWLADLIGPIQASSRILSELLAQFFLCYQNFQFEEVMTECIDKSLSSFVTGTYDSCINADIETISIFECLREFIALYGLAVVDHQFRHFLGTLLDNTKFLSDDFGEDRERSLICSVSLLRFLGMMIPDEYLEAFLSEKILDNYIPLIIKCIGNMAHPFPSGVRARKVLFHKTVDLIYLLSSRLKYEQIQLSMGNVLKLLFGLFNKTFEIIDNGDIVYRSMPLDPVTSDTDREPSKYVVNFSTENNDFTVYSQLSEALSHSLSTSDRQMAFEEMKVVITSELANVLYITFAKLLGQNRLHNLLCNHSLILALVNHHETNLSKSNIYSYPDKLKQQKLEDALQFFTSSVMTHKKRHLNGCWNQYWVHELGFCDSESFDIKQMCLGKFEGHNNSIKGFDVLNCENGFLSYSKDRVVKLYSCADVDYSYVANDVTARFNYSHQKSVSKAIFIEQMRMAVSLDGYFHLWDPFIGKNIHYTSLGVTSPNWNMICCIPPAQYQVAVANAEGRFQIIDLRFGSSTYNFNLNLSNTNAPSHGDFASSMGVSSGLIKEISGSPDGNQLIIGNSEGYISLIELRMNRLLQIFRPHQNEISQIKFIKNWCVTSSIEPNGKIYLFSLSNFSKNNAIFGSDLGSVHSLMMLRNQIIVGASQNRFGIFTNLQQYKSLNRLSSTLYKGTVTTSSLLIHNKLLLLGNDTGNISLWY